MVPSASTMKVVNHDGTTALKALDPCTDDSFLSHLAALAQRKQTSYRYPSPPQPVGFVAQWLVRPLQPCPTELVVVETQDALPRSNSSAENVLGYHRVRGLENRRRIMAGWSEPKVNHQKWLRTGDVYRIGTWQAKSFINLAQNKWKGCLTTYDSNNEITKAHQ